MFLVIFSGSYYALQLKTALTFQLTLDLSNETEAVITFKYAYANTNSSNGDHLRVLASKDCGETWSVRKIISNQYLPTAPDQNGAFIPTSPQSQWQQVYVNIIVSSYCVSDFRFKFAFYSDGGNNLYLDDINIFPASMLSYKEAANNTSVFPNPVNDFFHIEALSPIYSLTVFDLCGKIIKSTAINNLNKITLSTEGWKKGIYIIKVQFLNADKVIKIEKI